MDRHRARELIADVHASDRKTAREAISKGVQEAEAKWIQADLIAEALALELIELSQLQHHGAQIAGLLRNLALMLEARSDIH